MSRRSRSLGGWLLFTVVVCACRHSSESGPAQNGRGLTSDAGLHTDPGIQGAQLQIGGIGGLPGMGGMGGLAGAGGSGATGAIAGLARLSTAVEQARYTCAQESTAMPSSLRSSKYSGLTE